MEMVWGHFRIRLDRMFLKMGKFVEVGKMDPVPKTMSISIAD